MVRWATLSPIVLLLVIIPLVMVLRRALRPGTASSRRPLPRHIAMRIICGVLGGGILVAVVIGTVLSVKRCYEPPALPQAAPLHVPAEPAPALPELKRNPTSPGELVKGRVLAYLLLVDVTGGPPVLLASQEFDIRWPEDKGRDLNTPLEAEGLKIVPSRRLTEIYTDLGPPGSPYLQIGGWSFEIFGPGIVGVNGFNPGGGITGFLYHVRPAWPVDAALSIVPRGPRERELLLVAFSTLVAEDDPLREVTPGEFLASQPEAKRALGAGALTGLTWSVLDHPIPARGLMLVGHIGFSAALLFISAVLLAQLFTDRASALALLLVAAVLYVAALDRVALGMHLARLEDKSAPANVRGIACAQATETFFYGRTALECLNAVARDAAAPGPLRDLAHVAADRMKVRMQRKGSS